MSRTIKLDPGCSSEQAAELRHFLQSKIVDQHRAIDRLVLAYEYWLSPIWLPERPIIVALFLGPSGVGKTRIAEALAEFFCGNRSALTKVECSNFKERHELAKLIGSPPGYVGYNEPPLFSQDNLNGPAFNHKIERLSKMDPQAMNINSEIEALKEKISHAENAEKKALQDALKRKLANFYIYLNAAIKNERLVSVVLFDEFDKGHEALVILRELIPLSLS